MDLLALNDFASSPLTSGNAVPGAPPEPSQSLPGKKRKRKIEPDSKAQSVCYMKAAKVLGADESGRDFNWMMDTLVPRKPLAPMK